MEYKNKVKGVGEKLGLPIDASFSFDDESGIIHVEEKKGVQQEPPKQSQ
jgi:polysaccharide pyruvyl transferase WcaK-like protein